MAELKRDFLGVQDYDAQTLLRLVETALHMKNNKDKYRDSLKDVRLGMIFQKSSTRTRVSFEIGIQELGGTALFLSPRDTQLGRGEPISDTAQVLSRYLDILMIRTFAHSEIEELARYASIPVINGLTDLLHPCQAMADMLTILETKGQLAGEKLAYIGDGNNMAHSLGLLCTRLGISFSIASPKGYMMDRDIVKQIQANAAATGVSFEEYHDPKQAVSGADWVYTDVWTSMGQEEESQKRLKAFQGYEVNEELCQGAKADFHFLHCLPAHRGEEVSAAIIDGPHSLVFDQAENRLHAQKAIMHYLLIGE